MPKVSCDLNDKRLYVDKKATLGLPVLISVIQFDQISFPSSVTGTNLLCTAKWHYGSHLMEFGQRKWHNVGLLPYIHQSR